jgi:ATP-dependent Clp protease ATP-binding subunit ClpX
MDFIEFGFESEFIGRLPVLVNCQELSVDDLFQILRHSEGSIVRQYIQAFDAYGIDVTFRDDGLMRIAEKAYLEKTGARSLVGVCERTFREFKYHLPHSPARKIEVTAELVDEPVKVLESIMHSVAEEQLVMIERHLHSIAEQWSRRDGIEIHFTPEAARLLAKKALDSDRKAQDVFDETFRNYEHGLNLIRKTRGVNQFEITEDVIREPAATLDRWIRAYYIESPGKKG